jgi:hypothetical protein
VRSYCYLPLYVFCGRHLLLARQRRANVAGCDGAVEEIAPLSRGSAKNGRARIILRPNSGFCNDELMGWCEANRVDYVLGLARNRRLEAAQVDQLAEAKRRCAASGQPACVLRNFQYCTIDSWSRTVGLSARPSIRWRAPISLHRHLPQAHPRAPHSLRHRLRMSEQGRVRTRHVYLQRAFSSA